MNKQHDIKPFLLVASTLIATSKLKGQTMDELLEGSYMEVVNEIPGGFDLGSPKAKEIILDIVAFYEEYAQFTKEELEMLGLFEEKEEHMEMVREKINNFYNNPMNLKGYNLN